MSAHHVITEIAMEFVPIGPAVIADTVFLTASELTSVPTHNIGTNVRTYAGNEYVLRECAKRGQNE